VDRRRQEDDPLRPLGQGDAADLVPAGVAGAGPDVLQEEEAEAARYGYL